MIAVTAIGGIGGRVATQPAAREAPATVAGHPPRSVAGFLREHPERYRHLTGG